MMFVRLKHFCSVATRFEKFAQNFKAWFIACTFIWLKLNEDTSIKFFHWTLCFTHFSEKKHYWSACLNNFSQAKFLINIPDIWTIGKRNFIISRASVWQLWWNKRSYAWWRYSSDRCEIKRYWRIGKLSDIFNAIKDGDFTVKEQDGKISYVEKIKKTKV